MEQLQRQNIYLLGKHDGVIHRCIFFHPELTITDYHLDIFQCGYILFNHKYRTRVDDVVSPNGQRCLGCSFKLPNV
ncbi:hypothetical protein RQP46_002696 [Phenoliferia psychrophenolica]